MDEEFNKEIRRRDYFYHCKRERENGEEGSESQHEGDEPEQISEHDEAEMAEELPKAKEVYISRKMRKLKSLSRSRQ